MISAFVDRFEGDYAVIILGDDIYHPIKKINFPKLYLPCSISEGDYIKINIDIDENANDDAYLEAMNLKK